VTMARRYCPGPVLPVTLPAGQREFAKCELSPRFEREWIQKIQAWRGLWLPGKSLEGAKVRILRTFELAEIVRRSGHRKFWGLKFLNLTF